MINITEDEEQNQEQKYTDESESTYSSFLEELKDTLKQLDELPISEVRKVIQSPEFKEDRDLIERNFWKKFSRISKDDESLDTAILLQYYGIQLNRKPYEGITMIKELELEELLTETTLN